MVEPIQFIDVALRSSPVCRIEKGGLSEVLASPVGLVLRLVLYDLGFFCPAGVAHFERTLPWPASVSRLSLSCSC